MKLNSSRSGAVALLTIASVLGTTFAAIAAPPPAVYKTTDGEVVMHSGLTANQQVAVEYPNIPAQRSLKADYCGMVTVPSSDTQPIGSTVTVDSTAITVSSLPVQTKPRCVNNVLAEARPANFKLSNGSVVVVGKTPGVTYTATFDGSNTVRQVRANSCGFMVVRPNATYPIGTSLNVDGTAYTVSSLVSDAVPLCRTANGTSVRYNPASW
ncbi:hypothetical protein ACN4EK_05600 [Pantanalinema rosaneae CENA516]|uniref:hypothetical protein n=1 Tax=Pantanalinema rosaneae TaxID=1620701 RepID=UPI003D6F84B3